MEADNVNRPGANDINNFVFPIQLYNDLANEIIGTAEELAILKQFNSLSEEQYDLLDWAAYGFFFTVQRSLFQSVIIGIIRLIDTKKNRDDNKTMYRLVNELESFAKDDESRRKINEVRQQLNAIEESAKPLVRIRHNFIAHSALKPNTTPVEMNAIDAILHSLWEFLGTVRIMFTGVSKQGIEELKIPGDLNVLISRLSMLTDWADELGRLKQIDGWYKARDTVVAS